MRVVATIKAYLTAIEAGTLNKHGNRCSPPAILDLQGVLEGVKPELGRYRLADLSRSNVQRPVDRMTPEESVAACAPSSAVRSF